MANLRLLCSTIRKTLISTPHDIGRLLDQLQRLPPTSPQAQTLATKLDDLCREHGVTDGRVWGCVTEIIRATE